MALLRLPPPIGDQARAPSVATVELAAEVAVTEQVTGTLALLYEEGSGDSMSVDVATITIADPDVVPLSIVAGKDYLPFGNYYTAFVTDTPALELGETLETSMVLNLELEEVSTALALFSADVEEEDENSQISDFVAAVSATPLKGLEIGTSYLSNLADSDLLREEFHHPIHKKVAGWSAYAIAAVGEFTLAGEYLAALEHFDEHDLDFHEDGQGDKPHSWDIELGWTPHEKWEFAARYAKAKEVLELPDYSYGAVAAYDLFEKVTLALEAMREQYDHGTDGWVYTFQLGTEL